MIPKPTAREKRSTDYKPMVSQLIRITPKGYAEVRVVSHVGSHHQPDDIILMSIDEFRGGRVISGVPISDDELYRIVRPKPDNVKPTRSKPDAHPRGKSKSKSKKAAR